MKRLVVVAAFAFLPASVAHADGCPASTCGSTVSSEALPGSRIVALRPLGVQGPLVGYATSTGARRFSLPQGRLSGDSRTFVSWRYRGRETVLDRYDTRTGRVVGSWRIPGRAFVGSVSAHGDWVALYYLGRGNRSRFGLFDTRRGRVAHTVTWRGAYEAEAVSPDGRLLFLIHHTRYGYDLRTYDVDTHRLRATKLAERDEKMTGTAVNAVSSHDGRWLLTLYVEGGGGSFVHALDLRKGIAHCIDLPWRVTALAGPGTSSLAVSPDNARLYLANPMLGSVAVVDLRKLRLAGTVRFPAVRNTNGFYGSAAAVSPKGRMLAFGALDRIWAYDSAYRVVRGPFRAAQVPVRQTGIATAVTAVAFTPDGRRVTVLKSDTSRSVFDAATGRRIDRRLGGDLFAIAAGYGIAPLVGYDKEGGPRFSFPDGRLTADGSQFFAALPQGRDGTSLRRYSPRTGRLVSATLVRGRWSLGAVSASGRAIALARHAHGATHVRIVDARGRTLRDRLLHGVFTMDAVSDDAQRLFLIERYPSGRYSVRALSFRTGRLWTATLREKGEKEQPLMQGRATAQVGSRDGTWLLTLYLDTKKRSAFVHALNLRSAYAVCIDLPSDGHSLRTLHAYSLALGPDERVYASNGALGVVARVDLRRQALAEKTRFTPLPRLAGWAASAISRDGRMLYFSSGNSVWRYDTVRDDLAGPRLAPDAVLGLAVSRDGRNVYAPRVDGGVSTFARFAA